MDYSLLAISAAYILDLIFGDPHWQWHPVRFIGRLIGFLEERLNIDGFNLRLAGIILVIVVVAVTISCAWGILKLAGLIHPLFYYFVLTLCIYFGLSVKSLAVEVNKVRDALVSKDITSARQRLSMIVGRDTVNLDEREITRAAVETVAESITDGIIAPLFYCFLAGPCLMWLYKAVNTLDSMVGYQNKRFKEFGWASAKLDGLMNFVPSRITSLLIIISGLALGKYKYTFNSIKWAGRYFFSRAQDNSQLTEAVMAGAIGVQIGGVNFYESVPAVKPFIGEEINPLSIKHINESIRISYLCSALMMLAVITFPIPTS